jgi:hypothetical protein
MTEPDSKLPLSKPARTVRRIIAEAFFVAFIGAMFFGIAAELRFWKAGEVGAIIIWVVGTPVLEIIRVIQSKK